MLSSREWREGVLPESGVANGFYVEKAALNAAYDSDGRLCLPVDLRVVGDVQAMVDVLRRHAIEARIQETARRHTRVTLIPPPH